MGGVLHRKMQRFRGGLVFKADRIVYHSTLGLRVIKKKGGAAREAPVASSHEQVLCLLPRICRDHRDAVYGVHRAPLRVGRTCQRILGR